MSKWSKDESDLVLRLVDVVIADLTVGLPRFLARRPEDGDAENTFVVQLGEEGRLRLPRPVLSSPVSVISMARSVQRKLVDEVAEPVPRCPLHGHALDLVAAGANDYGWVCPAGQWRCALGDYAERAWPHILNGDLASLLGRRLDRRGITGVRSWGVTAGENGPVASFHVADLTPEIVSALTDAAAPIEVMVQEHPRQPRKVIGPVAARKDPGEATTVRLALLQTAVRRGDSLNYSVVNEGGVSIMTGVGFALDQQENGWWYSVDTELLFVAVGIGVPAGQQRAFSAEIPARAVPGIYRLRKSIRPSVRKTLGLDAAEQASGLPAELTAEFHVTAP